MRDLQCGSGQLSVSFALGKNNEAAVQHRRLLTKFLHRWSSSRLGVLSSVLQQGAGARRLVIKAAGGQTRNNRNLRTRTQRVD